MFDRLFVLAEWMVVGAIIAALLINGKVTTKLASLGINGFISESKILTTQGGNVGAVS